MEEYIESQEKGVIIVNNSTVILRKLNNILYTDNLCGLCFEKSSELNSIDQELEIIGDFGVQRVVLENIITYLLKYEIEDMANKFICIKCFNQIYNAYLFIKNTDYNLRMLVKYIDHIDSRAQEVKDLGNQENLHISVWHDEVKETDNDSKIIIVESGFKCSKCEKVSNNFGDMKSHEKLHQWTFRMNCKFCNELVYRKEYNKHLRMKHLDIAYSCPYCYSAYLMKRDYLNHLKRHEQGSSIIIEGVAKCELCFKQLNPSNYKTHKCKFSCADCDVLQCVHYKYLIACRTQMVNRTRFRCPETPCKYVCKKKQLFVGHLNREHLDYHPYTCDICKQEFYSKRMMKKHIIKYHQETYFCNYCCKDFRKEKNAYKSHLVMCQSVERDFKCSDCEASFDKEEELLQHQKSCRRYCCESCNQRFVEERFLLEHKRKVHNGLQIIAKYPNCLQDPLEHKRAIEAAKEPAFLCDVCAKAFKTKSNLQSHKLRHTKKVKCAVCSKLVYERRMEIHLRKHSEPKRLKGPKCNHCSYSVKSYAYLEAHVNQVHLKIRPYHCEYCDKTYCGKIDLDNHKLSHTRPNQILCEICSKPLFDNRSYKKHMAKHTGFKPFKCEQCGEGFFSLGELNYHKNRHKEKSISCPMPHCKTKFSLMTSLRTHFKKVHWKQKGKTFDPKLVVGLDEQYYHLFEDNRRRKIVED